MKAFLRILGRLFVFSMLGVLAWSVYGTSPYWSSFFSPTPTTFSQSNWLAAHRYKRLDMARDFLKKHSPVGMKRDEITALLGSPDYQTPHSLTYLLAPTTADFMALSFRLDEQGRIVQAYIHQT